MFKIKKYRVVEVGHGKWITQKRKFLSWEDLETRREYTSGKAKMLREFTGKIWEQEVPVTITITTTYPTKRQAINSISKFVFPIPSYLLFS